MADDRSDAAGYLGWFLFGAVVGAAAALLTAPRPGRDTRSLLVERGGEAARRAQELRGEATRRAQDWAGEAQTQASAWLDKSRELLEEQTQRLMTAFEAGKEAMREEIRRWAPATPPS